MLLLLTSLALAGDGPSFQAELQYRPRLELRTVDLDADATHFVAHRAALGGRFTRGPLTARVQLRDVRTWGEELGTMEYSADGLDLHLGYLEWTPDPALGLRIGRQEISFHEQRIFGAVGWTHQGRAFDGARVLLAQGPVNADVFVAITAEGDATTWGPGDTAMLGGARMGWKGDSGGLVDGLYVAEVDWGKELRRHTFGAYARGKSGILSGRLEAYGQYTEGLAYLLGASGTVAPELSAKPTVTLWYDLLSGGDHPFAHPYGTNHKFYGLVDVMGFTQVGGWADGRGLHDPALKLAVNPVDSLKVNLDGHLFLAADGEMLGQEVDFWAGRKVGGMLGVSGGGSALLQPEQPLHLWGWLMLDAKL